MFLLKRISILVILTMAAVSMAATNAAAQSQTAQREMTVEESYLQESIELMIIRETARATTREQKMIAIEYIRDAIDRGNTSPEIAQTLRFLALEGTPISQSRENGRLLNNFPEVKRQAAKELGRMGTQEAVAALLDIVRYNNEPMVLQEAIKSLGDIGINNDNNDTVRFIAHTVRHNNNTNPDNLMALATIDAFEKLAKSNDGLSRDAVEVLVLISENYRYATPVRERSRQALAELRSYGGSGNERSSYDNPSRTNN